MSGEQLEEAEADRLGAAVFEQRRLAHMLRRRGAEIEVLRGDRERLAARERKGLEREEELRRRVDEVKQKVESVGAERDRLAGELKRVEYEIRRSERRLAKVAEDAAEAVKRLEGESAEALRRAKEEEAGALNGAREEHAKALEKVEAEAAEALKSATEESAQALERVEAESAQALKQVEAESAEALKQAEYEARRAERRTEEARGQLSALASNRDRIATELKQAEYEARRAERRLASTERDAADARRRDRLQLDALRAELREGLSSRDDALKREQRVLTERDEVLDQRDEAFDQRDEALDQRDEALAEHREAIEALERERAEERAEERVAAAESARGVEATALELGRAQREVELLVGLESGREVLLADSESTLDDVADHLWRVRASRSWRWGHAFARALRAITFRRRSERSALDSALDRLGADRAGPSPG